MGRAGTITIANLTLKGTVFRAGAFAGAKSFLVVGGAGGWSKKPSPQAYANPNGVRKSMVLRDAAASVGESVRIDQDGPIGVKFVRDGEAPAVQVLRSVLGEAWWVDELGVTQCQDRTNVAPIKSAFTVVVWSGARARFEIATEDLASWMPARTFTSETVPESQTISLTSIQMEGEGKLRLEVLAAA